MKTIVCGGRDFYDGPRLYAVLDSLGISEVIHGGARGADFLASQWAKNRGIPCKAFPADWNRHGRSAGVLRNREMLRENPTLVVAFPGRNGTADMVRRAASAGIEVIRVP